MVSEVHNHRFKGSVPRNVDEEYFRWYIIQILMKAIRLGQELWEPYFLPTFAKFRSGPRTSVCLGVRKGAQRAALRRTEATQAAFFWFIASLFRHFAGK